MCAFANESFVSETSPNLKKCSCTDVISETTCVKPDSSVLGNCPVSTKQTKSGVEEIVP